MLPVNASSASACDANPDIWERLERWYESKLDIDAWWWGWRGHEDGCQPGSAESDDVTARELEVGDWSMFDSGYPETIKGFNFEQKNEETV